MHIQQEGTEGDVPMEFVKQALSHLEAAEQQKKGSSRRRGQSRRRGHIL